MKGLISCSVACRFYDIPTGKCRLKCEKKSNPDAEFYDDCPLPDAVEVKHGRWISQGSGYNFVYTCSACGYIDGYPFNDRHKFCPQCGAKMDGGENDGN